jgi:hypothetical protein
MVRPVMRPSSKRLIVGLLLVLAAGGVWFASARRGPLHRGADVPEEARSLLGCWKIVSSSDERYPVRQSVCLHPDRVVVVTPDGSVYDGWQVTWSREGADWRMTVPSDQTEGFDVHFVIGAADGGGLTFRSGAGWVGVTLGDRSAPRDDDVLERLGACRACVVEAIQASPTLKDVVGSPPYALRACTMMARTAGSSTCDLHAIEGR